MFFLHDEIPRPAIRFTRTGDDKGNPNGMLIATYSIPMMLRSNIPSEVSERVNFELLKTLENKKEKAGHASHFVKLNEIGKSVVLFGYSKTPLTVISVELLIF